jgi:glycosyltransferase involved in cell wall biosynthesis
MQVLAVVALYRRPIHQSQTLNSLNEILRSDSELLSHLRVLIFDNSPSPTTPNLEFPFDYIHADHNVGTAGAFNRAMELAEVSSIPWLLLLDQDTIIPENFIAKMLDYAGRFEHNPEIAAVVPLLWCRGELISPKTLRSLYRVVPLSPSCYGTCKQQMIACDSATLMRTSALREAGGYDENLFWLDFSDIHVFAAFHRNARFVYVANDLQLQHSLSTMDYDKDMTTGRYANFLAAEGTFLLDHGSGLDNAALTIRLLARSVRQYYKHKNKEFARMSWKAFCDRLVVPRSQRTREWKDTLARRS